MTEQGQVIEMIQRYDDLHGEQANWRAHWEECAQFCKPERKDFHDLPHAAQGGKKHSQIYDGTPESAVEVAVAGTHTGVTSPNMQWFDYGLPDDDDKDREGSEWMEETTRRMYRALGLSNFNTSIYSTYMDFWVFGTPILYLELGRNRALHFSPRHLRECVIAEDSDEVVDTVIRKFSYTARQAAQEFRNPGEAVTKALGKSGTKEPDKKFKFLHAVLPRHERDIRKKDNLSLPWGSYYIAVDGEELLQEGGYHEMPYMVPRANKVPGEVYGRAAAMRALADIKSLNTMARDNLEAGELLLKPPLHALENNYKGRIRMIPDAISYYDDKDGRLEPILPPTNAPFTVEMQERYDRKVRQHFYVDAFLMLDTEAGNRTATEVLERKQEKMLMLGPLLAQLAEGLLDPLLDRVFGLLLRNGGLPPIPESIQKRYGDRRIDPEYIGPLYLAQQQADVLAINQVYRDAAMLAQATQNPGVFDFLNTDEAVKIIHARRGAPAAILRSGDEVAKMRQAREEKAEQAAQLQQAGAVAEAAGKVGVNVQELMQGGADGTVD